MKNALTFKESKILEIKKLVNILSTWGNVLVPGIEGGNQVHAKNKLQFCVTELIEKENMTVDQIEESII